MSVREELVVWPCDNYLAPHTCLTARSARGAECDFCTRQAAACRRVVAEEIAAAIESSGSPLRVTPLADEAFMRAARTAREVGEAAP